MNPIRHSISVPSLQPAHVALGFRSGLWRLKPPAYPESAHVRIRIAGRVLPEERRREICLAARQAMLRWCGSSPIVSHNYALGLGVGIDLQVSWREDV